MKLHRRGLLGVTIIALTVASPAGADDQSVVGSRHDLSSYPAITGSIGACAFCHVIDPGSGQLSARLNRNRPISTFTLYDSATLANEIKALGADSLHCLSCHDGVTPFDALGESNGTENNNMSTLFPASTAITGTDLSRHHPVGVMVPGTKDFEQISVIAGAGLPVFDGKVECPSCHEVHGGTGTRYFLRLENPEAALCQTCHVR